MKHFSISEILGHSWKLFAQNPYLLGGLALLCWAVHFINKYLMFLSQHASSREAIGLFSFTTLALAILTVLIHIGIFKIGLDLVDGKKARLDDFLHHPNLFWKFVFMSIISGVVLFLSFIIPVAGGFFLALAFHKISYITLGFLGIIPAGYILLTFFYAPAILVDTDSTVVQSFKRAAKISRGNRWSIMGFIFALLVVNALGAIAFGVGLLISAPIAFLSYLTLYRKLAQ